MIKGTYVKRSTYQKLAEENKKLLKDIYILTDIKYFMTTERLHVIQRWKKKWKEDKDLNDMIKEAITAYIEEHPEYRIIKKSIDDATKNQKHKKP